ncbi:amidohydrolase [Marinimicrococcus flavescens]|uniref:Amidohydrolase n=1 Tax=Marinimicrococcus flavescens TaxID=3031815 RepID=A0AAP3V1C3_9PROT|nr:amidohydrolase [Marinimicrococcus flavescens]
MGLPTAELVLRNGRVWCGLQEGSVEAVAVWAGRVLATGSNAEIEPLIGPATKVIDLEGRLATPGLNDAHLHLLPLGLAMADIDARPAAAPTLEILLGKFREAAARAKPGQWLMGRGYDHSKLDVGRHPLREELDAAAPDNPVYLVRTCGHVAVANSMALELAGIDEDTLSPPGGLIERRDGRLTGLLAEHGRDAVKAVLPEPSDEELVAAIERAGQYCLSLGVTSVMDAAVGMRSGFREIRAYNEARRSGRLPVRTYQCLLGGEGGIVEQAYEAGLVSGAGDDMLMVGCVKIFTDGSAGGKTAAMSEPYLGDPDNRGILCLTDEQVDAHVMDYHAKGYQLAIHAIGDVAIEQVLRAYEKALAAHPAPGRRHRIEHCGFLSEGQMARMKALGIEPVPQPVFIWDFGDLYLEVVGEERSAASYPMRRWQSMGMVAAASTDAPVCDVDPFPNLYTMVTRRSAGGAVIGGEERLELAEALSAYTLSGAFVSHCEDRKGRLVPGQLADIAVFSRDMLAGEPEAILETRCDLAILGGSVAYDRHGEA